MSLADSKFKLTHRAPTFRFHFKVCFFLTIATALLYIPALTCGFVDFFDSQFVTGKPVIAGKPTWHNCIAAWMRTDFPGWTPLASLSWKLDAALFGINSAAFHATSLLLHCLNVSLLFVFLTRMTNAVVASGITAILFAIHPLHVEPVVWISGRREVLGTLVLLLSLLAYDNYRRTPSLRQLTIVTFTVAVALVADSNLVILPALFFLMDLWPLERSSNSLETDKGKSEPVTRTLRLVEKLPLVLPSLVVVILMLLARREHHGAENENLPLLLRAGFAIQVYGYALWKTIFPTCLSVYYPWRPLSAATVAFSLVARCCGDGLRRITGKITKASRVRLAVVSGHTTACCSGVKSG